MEGFKIVIAPHELAETAAMRIYSPERQPLEPDEEARMLGQLDTNAAALQVMDRPYKIDTSLGIVLPITGEVAETGFEDTDIPVTNFYSASFAGRFACHSTLVLEDYEMSGPDFKALCLGFAETELMPDRSPLPEGFMLFVPVLAVNEMQVITASMWSENPHLSN